MHSDRKVRIYKPAKSAMQSGRARTNRWLLEFDPVAAPTIDPLMGWTGSRDTQTQVRLEFDRCEDAVEFAKKNGWDYRVSPAHERKVIPRNYADNFRYIPPKKG